MVGATIGGGILLSKIRYWFPLYLIGIVSSLVGTIFLYFSTIESDSPARYLTLSQLLRSAIGVAVGETVVI
jgi:hypothetical protein